MPVKRKRWYRAQEVGEYMGKRGFPVKTYTRAATLKELAEKLREDVESKKNPIKYYRVQEVNGESAGSRYADKISTKTLMSAKSIRALIKKIDELK